MILIKPRNKWLWFTLLAAILCTLLVVASPVMARGPGGGGGGGGGGVIDPPPGAVFKDPPLAQDISTEPGVVEVNIEAKIAQVNIHGTMANLLTYNGMYPDPTIKIKRSDTLRINYKNSLPETTETNILGFVKNHSNLHTHGLHVSPKEPADAAHLDIAPGQTYKYEYDLSYLDPGALTFLHPHAHGLVAEQYWGGMLSAIQGEDEVTALSSYESHIMVLKDITLNGTEPEPYDSHMDFMHGKEGSIVMVNGLVNPVLSIKPGQIQRWQILNASNARYYKLSLQGHSLYLVGTDGGLLDKPYAQSSILMAPGERIDVLVKASSTKGSYKLLALPYSRMGNMNSPQITLLTLSDQGRPVSSSLPATVDPNAERLNIDTSNLPKRTLVLSMSQGRGYINGQDFDIEPYTIMSEVSVPGSQVESLITRFHEQERTLTAMLQKKVISQ